MDAGIKVGNQITKEAMEPMADAIVRILEARADQETIREGLRALGRLTEIKDISFSNVTITNSDRGIGVVMPDRDPDTGDE